VDTILIKEVDPSPWKSPTSPCLEGKRVERYEIEQSEKMFGEGNSSKINSI
jgi:hypothetical protein